MDIKPEFDSTTLLAIYGAVLSTVIFIFEIYKIVRDKPRLKITSVVAGFIVGGSQKPDDSDPQLVITITNVGTKSAVVTMLAGTKAENIFIVNAIELPKSLKPGEYVNVISKDLTGFKDTIRLFAIDSLNKKYYCSTKTLNKAKKSIEAILSKG